MNQNEVMEELAALGNEQTRKTYARHGVTGDAFGVRYGDLHGLRKRCGTDQSLAEALWVTDNHDARVLATMVADPQDMTAAKLDVWVQEVADRPMSDALATLAAASPVAQERANAWIDAEQELVASTGWHLLARLAGQDGALDDTACAGYLQRIERDIQQSPNWVRYAMNGALIALGLRNQALQIEAVAAARRIGKVEVDHGQTSCKTPDAVDYIERAAARRGSAQKIESGSRVRGREARSRQNTSNRIDKDPSNQIAVMEAAAMKTTTKKTKSTNATGKKAATARTTGKKAGTSRKTTGAAKATAAKKATAKKTTAKKTAAKKTAVKKATAKKTTGKKTAAKKATAKKTTGKKTTAKNGAGKKAPARKTGVKTAAKKVSAKGRASKKASARKPAAKAPKAKHGTKAAKLTKAPARSGAGKKASKVSARKPAAKAAARKTSARNGAAKKASARKPAAAKAAARKTSAGNGAAKASRASAKNGTRGKDATAAKPKRSARRKTATSAQPALA